MTLPTVPSSATPETASIEPLKPSAPPLLRLVILVVMAITLERLFWLLHVTSPSERFHYSVPLLWSLDFWFFQRWRTRIEPKAIAVIIAMALTILLLYWALLVDQARGVGGRVDLMEVWVRFYLTCSLFVIYWVISSLLTWLFNRLPATRNAMAAPRGWVVREIRKAIAILIIAPYLLPFLNIHRFKVPDTTNPQRELKLPYEDVTFPAAIDGTRLRGWYIPSKDSDATVVVCHGLGANKANFLGIVPFLHRAGFNVLMFDFRGHGDSDGHTISFGYYEARDVSGAVEFAQRQPGIRHIATYGFSMGGAAVIDASPGLPAVQAVVADSAFADFLPLVRQQVNYLPCGLDTIMLNLTNLYTHFELGIGLSNISPKRYVAKISPRPLFLIHGLADNFIVPDQARENYALARQPKTLWLVPKATHCASHLINPKPYERRVAAFLKAAFAGYGKSAP